MDTRCHESKMDDGGLGLQSPPVRQIILWDEFGALCTHGCFDQACITTVREG
jgi:hypothetical protein